MYKSDQSIVEYALCSYRIIIEYAQGWHKYHRIYFM